MAGKNTAVYGLFAIAPQQKLPSIASLRKAFATKIFRY